MPEDILLSPGSLHQLSLANRIVMEPMISNLANPDGSVSQRLIDFIVARAAHVPGLIILEGASVHPSGKGYARQLVLDDDRFVAGLTELVEKVHATGVPILAQLIHTGRCALPGALPGQPVAPSAISPRIPRHPPRELSPEEIAELIGSFAAAARRAKAAGFDGVEIQASSGYLISSFLSPYSNRRTDRYGGSLENRARFLLEIIEAIRAAVGPDYPVSCRFNGDEIMEEGNRVDELIQIGQMAISQGINAINLVVGWHESRQPVVTMDGPPAWWPSVVARLRPSWKTCLIMAYGIHTPARARQVLGDGICDLVGWARPFMADPALPGKIRQGRENEIRPCVSCCIGCFGQIFRGQPITCAVNPWVGREADFETAPPVKTKKVLVIGGGPAGMQAAVEAGRRGHRVILLEKEDRLGGQLRLAGIPPHRQRWESFLNYLEEELARTGVEVRTRTLGTEEIIEKERPEVLIRAVGALPAEFAGPGLERWPTFNAIEILGMTSLPPLRKWVVIGGGLIGLETAEFLADQGKEVVVLEKDRALAKTVSPLDRASLISRVRRKVSIHLDIGEIRVENDRLTAVAGNNQLVFNPEGVVVAVGMLPNPALKEVTINEGQKFDIGDCRQVSNILSAVEEGAVAGTR